MNQTSSNGRKGVLVLVLSQILADYSALLALFVYVRVFVPSHKLMTLPQMNQTSLNGWKGVLVLVLSQILEDYSTPLALFVYVRVFVLSQILENYVSSTVGYFCFHPSFPLVPDFGELSCPFGTFFFSIQIFCFL